MRCVGELSTIRYWDHQYNEQSIVIPTTAVRPNKCVIFYKIFFVLLLKA